MTQRKIFRAVTETVCEKAFLQEWDNKPEGWHWSTRDALAAFAPKPKRGRPPKVESAEPEAEATEAEAEA